MITHAGGPGVIVTDTLTQNGLLVPDLSKKHQNSLKQILYPGAAIANPIDILATGTANQLEQVMAYCEHDLKEIDAMIVIFGSPGLGSVKEAYEVIHQMIETCSKPIFPIFPSVENVKDEINQFIKKGNMAFSDEYSFAKNLAKIMEHSVPEIEPYPDTNTNDIHIRSLIKEFSSGFLGPKQAYALMEAAGIKMARQVLVKTESELLKAVKILHYPLVQKIVGPLHKTDKEGVIVNVLSDVELEQNFRKLMRIDGAKGVLIQEMIKGKEVFIGAKRETAFPPLVICGAGGVYIEALKDFQSALAPISRTEAMTWLTSLE